jgi:hypothetical protein
MKLSDARRDRLGSVLPLAGCLVAGFVVWTLFVVGRVGHEGIPVGFWVVAFGVAVVAGLLVDEDPAFAAAAVFAGPTVAAWWTAPVGDGDGLSILLMPAIVVAGGLAWVLATAVRRLVRDEQPRKLIRRVATRHPFVVGAVVLVCALGAVQLFLNRRANPYPALERLVATFPVPDAARLEGIVHHGDPLCSAACAAEVEAMFLTSETPDAACETVGEALHAWRGFAAESGEGWFESEACFWEVDSSETTGWAVVVGERSGTEIRIALRDLRGASR